KQALKQALLRRGRHDFPSQEAYSVFLHELGAKRNRQRKEAFSKEGEYLQALPARRLEAFQRWRVRVQPGSVITGQRNLYSVPARLIGEWVEVRVQAETLEVWYGQRQEEVLPRLQGRDKHHLNYRHVIDWLVRKPGAFHGY